MTASMAQIAPILALVACSYAITRIAIFLSAKFNIQDLPNSRSSHQRPTPRGGGIAIVLTFAIGCGIWLGGIPARLLWGVLLPGLVVAAVGYLDDIRHLSAKIRLTIHLFVSLVASYWIYIGTDHSPALLEWLWIGVCALGIAWLINLTNFMDGIDGILGVQTVSVSLLAAGLCWMRHDEWMARLYLILAASSLGFLLLNWSPAKIFMGDVGSGFIGFVYGALMLFSHFRGTLPLETELILFGVFICDATYTLIVRAGRGCDLTAAHREHAYQKAVQRGLSHAKVSSRVGAINFLWLAPWAYLSTLGHPIVCLVLAYLPLVALVLHYQAGFPNRPLETQVHTHA